MSLHDRATPRQWRGAMIAPDCDAGQGTRASFVGQRFTIDRVTGDEVLTATAQGLYIAFINGQRVGTSLLTPGWTVYDDRIAFQSYPVADLLKPGENRIEIWLGDGWWRSQLMWAQAPIFNCWGDKVAAMAEITSVSKLAENTSTSKLIVATGADWHSGLLPVTRNGIYWGESYDARLEALVPTDGVSIQPMTPAQFVPHEVDPVVEMAPLPVVDHWADDQGRVIYDFAQNCGAYVRFTVEGEAGATVLVEHSEQLGPHKVWDNRNYRSARAAVDYVLKGGAPETFAPHFTFMGYRYARVTLTGKARITAIASIPVTSLPVQTAQFESGHKLVNRLVENTVWSQRSNFIEVPTDCPQRDERLGWTGDAQVFAGTACWLADSEAMLRKFLRDVMADQREDGGVPHFSPDPTRLHQVPGRGTWAGSTGWGDAIVIIPWQLYLHYGDTGVLAECLPAMVRWLDYLWSISDGPVIYPHSTWGKKGFTFGDWLQPVGDNRKPRPTVGDDCAATMYHFISTDLTARIAGLLGDAALSQRMAGRAAQIKAAFAHEFVTASGRLAHNDQTSYAIAFLHGLVPPQHVDAAKAQFRRVVEDADYLIGTGFIGTPDLLPALSRLGMHDLAAKVFLNEKVPGWLYQVRQGATTIWERWDALGPDGTIYDPEMNSYNHYAYGAVCQWLFESVAGLRPDPARPGFAGVILDPVIIADLGFVKLRHDSPKGPVSAEWSLSGTRVTYAVSLPEGCSGQFVLTGRSNVQVNGAAAGAEVTLGSGRNVISFDQK